MSTPDPGPTMPPVIPVPPEGVPYVPPLDPPMSVPPFVDPCLPSGTTQYGILPCTPTPTDQLPATGAGLTIAAIAVIFVAVGAQLRKFPKRRQTP